VHLEQRAVEHALAGDEMLGEVLFYCQGRSPSTA
jgi:hypothetical protein